MSDINRHERGLRDALRAIEDGEELGWVERDRAREAVRREIDDIYFQTKNAVSWSPDEGYQFAGPYVDELIHLADEYRKAAGGSNQWDKREKLRAELMRLESRYHDSLKEVYRLQNTAPPKRKPLTEEEILSLFRTSGSPTAFARAVERAHGITL